ncbi:MAG: NUDIX domain-containing protein [Patescibacteria group bacterium]|nr:NUDIX domain-containing protein [Patescibacteria group bacterium]
MTLRQSAGGIIVGPMGKLLLVYQHNDSWSFPKGGLEEGESELDAAKREIAEETGVTDLLLLGELGSYERYSIAKGGVGEDYGLGLRKRTFFLFATGQTEASPRDDEVTQTRWVSVDEALALLTHPKDAEFLQSVRTKVEEELQ